MSRTWDKPILIPSTVSRDREHIELFTIIDEKDVSLALLAPEVPVHADNGRIRMQWIVGDSSTGEKNLRKLIKTELDEHLLEKDDPMPWTTLVYQCFKSETLCYSGDDRIGWRIEHGLPTTPPRPDWMFDDIADDELIACCLWEYGRESHTLRLAADDYWVQMRHVWLGDVYAENSELVEWHNKKQAWIEQSMKEAGDACEEFIDRFWDSDLAFIEIYDALRRFGGSSATPWQELPPDERERLVSKVGESHILRPLAPASLGELERLWKVHNGRLLEIRSENRPPNDDTEDMEMFSETTPVEVQWEDDEKPPERVSAALTVDFSRFTDREILDAFRAWLKETRPPQWERPRRIFPNAPQRGRKLLDYRVALERLALMRLLNDNYPDDLRKNYPAVWKKLCRSDTHFRRECKLACDFFHTLFPFLPEDELPRSSKPVEIWEPEIEEELARKESDETPPTGK